MTYNKAHQSKGALGRTLIAVKDKCIVDKKQDRAQENNLSTNTMLLQEQSRFVQ